MKNITIAASLMMIAVLSCPTQAADTIAPLPVADITFNTTGLLSVKHGGTTYTTAQLGLGTTLRYYAVSNGLVPPGDSGVRAVWVEGTGVPVDLFVIPNSSNAKSNDYASRADNFAWNGTGSNASDMASIDALPYLETMFANPVKVIFCFERGGNDSGTVYGIRGGVLGTGITLTGTTSYGGAMAYTGGSAYAFKLTFDQAVNGIRIAAPGFDALTICTIPGSPAVYLEPLNNSIGITSPVTFKWESSYQGAGKVLSYTLNMDDTQANVQTPIAGNLIYNQVVTVGGSTPPPYAAQYTYNNALVNDQDYFWRVDTVVGEPNYNVPDPNFPLYNLTNTFAGSVWKFTGPVTIPLLTGPSDVVIEPNQFTHEFDNTDAVFTAGIACSVPIVNVQWFKEGNATPLANGGQYTIAWGQTQTTLTITNATTANNGKYYCKVFTANTSAESSHALLYRQIILKHRYSFSGDLVDSIGGANGTLINHGGTWASVTSSELVLANTGQVSGDANSINTAGGYVQLPGNLIQPMGNYGTFVVWFTSTDPNNVGSQRLIAFGDPGAQPFNSDNCQYAGLQSNTQMAFITDRVGTGNEENTDSGNTVATANTQFCLVGRFDGVAHTQTVFVNGVQKGVDTGVTFDFYGLTDTTNYIGRSMTPTQPLFKGKINELRIYDIALTNAWIKAIYDAGPESLNANPCNNPKTYDYTGDCLVTLADFAVFAQNWLYCGRLTCQ